jgi:hypothetical protein
MVLIQTSIGSDLPSKFLNSYGSIINYTDSTSSSSLDNTIALPSSFGGSINNFVLSKVPDCEPPNVSQE